MMKRNQFQIQADKKNLLLTAEQLVFYKQSKVLEATDKNGSYYYLIFYKNDFINGIKRNQIKINSHIHHAFTKGIHFDGDHPIARKLLQNQKTFHLISINQLYKSIQKSYSKLETALLLSYFDSFTKTGSIQKLFKRTFYEYRRNGQNFIAYQLLKTYSNTHHETKFIHNMMNDLQLQNYKALYQDIEKVYEKDPIYFEASASDQSYKGKYSELLYQLYQEQNRTLDELAIRTVRLNRKFSKSNFDAILSILNDFQLEDQIQYLQQIKQNTDVTEHVMKLLVASERANDIAKFIMATDYIPSGDQMELVTKSFEDADANVISSYFDESAQRLLQLSEKNAVLLEKLVTPFVSAFLQDYELRNILEWLKPFRTAGVSLPIERKLLKMKAMTDDPDQQFALGEMYVQFDQLEKSIDCFKWEMELHPEDRNPVTYLSKIYQQLGDKDEASAYQQLLIQMSR